MSQASGVAFREERLSCFMTPLKIPEPLDFIALLGEEREQENGRQHLRACDVRNAVIQYRFLRFNVTMCI